jgi:hypothetical protein
MESQKSSAAQPVYCWNRTRNVPLFYYPTVTAVNSLGTAAKMFHYRASRVVDGVEATHTLHFVISNEERSLS